MSTKSTSTMIAEKPASRVSGTACLFQIPPSPNRLPSVPTCASALAANAAAPATSEDPAALGFSKDATSHGELTATVVAAIQARSRLLRAAAMPVIPAKRAPVGVRPAAAMALVRHKALPICVARTTAGSNNTAMTSDHCPWSKRSTTNGFQSSIVGAIS